MAAILFMTAYAVAFWGVSLVIGLLPATCLFAALLLFCIASVMCRG